MLKPAFAILLLAISAHTAAQDVELWQCQQWQDKIDHYSYLRKKGGTARQMESWKQARKPYKDKFQDNKCLKYGKKLK